MVPFGQKGTDRKGRDHREIAPVAIGREMIDPAAMCPGPAPDRPVTFEPAGYLAQSGVAPHVRMKLRSDDRTWEESSFCSAVADLYNRRHEASHACLEDRRHEL